MSLSSPQLYEVRCSPDCPYEDCVILTNVPPSQTGDGGESEQGGQQNDPNKNKASDSSNPADSRPDNNSQDNQAQAEDSPAQTSNNGGADKNNGADDRDAGDDGRPNRQPNEPSSQGQPANSKPAGSPAKQRPEPQPSPQKDTGGDEDTQDKSHPQPSPQEEVEPYRPIYDVNAPLDLMQSLGAGHEIKAVKPKFGKLELITDQVFQARLKNVLVDNAFDRRVKGRKRGQLDMKSLFKTAVKAENIFTLKEARKNKNYNVILIVDQSGSMQDYTSGRLRIAIECATFLARALGRVNINYSVIGFGSNWAYYKKFNQVATDDFLKKMGSLMQVDRGGTSLEAPLREAYKELRKTPEAQNIVITLTDGEPNNPDDVKHLIHGNRHVAETIDIGISHRPITSNGVIVNDLDELKPTVIKELRKRVKRG